jgi:uncharacterized membrane protein YGL010W
MTESPKLDAFFSSYSADHVNQTNQAIHVVAVPAILWSVIALLWCVPPLMTWFQYGIWAALAMFTAWCYYNRLSRSLGYGMLLIFFVFGCSCRLLEAEIGIPGLFKLALGVFVVAWIAQFIGHKIEGRRPSFLTDLVYLLIGPIWVLAKGYRQMGWRY